MRAGDGAVAEGIRTATAMLIDGLLQYCVILISPRRDNHQNIICKYIFAQTFCTQLTILSSFYFIIFTAHKSSYFVACQLCSYILCPAPSPARALAPSVSFSPTDHRLWWARASGMAAQRGGRPGGRQFGCLVHVAQICLWACRQYVNIHSRVAHACAPNARKR